MKIKNVTQKAEIKVSKESIYTEDKTKVLDLLLDQADEILAFIDIHLRYLHVNKAYANWYGIQKNDFVGKYVSEILDEDTFQVILPKFIKSFQGEHVTFEYAEKSELTEATLIPQYNKDLEVIGCICLLKRKSIFREKSWDNYNLNKLINFTLGLLCITDKMGGFLNFSPSWEKTLGYSVGEFKDLNFFSLIHPDEKDYHLKKIGKPKNQKILSFCNRFLCKDGTFKWLEGHSYSNDGFFYTVALEVTKHIETAETLKLSEARLKELNDTKDRFFAIISHDLKSPFNNILGFANLLRANIESYDKDTCKHISNQLYFSAKMAFELLENLLDWSRLQTNRIEFEPSVINLNKLLNNCLPMMQLMASTKQISIEVIVPPNLSVFADENITRTVIRNLISNSVKFSNIDDKIIVTAKKSKNYAYVSIADSGIGMSPKVIEKLFRIDTKYSSPGTMNERGTGLGLILCKDFVEKQGGFIHVESEEGKGSTFTFTIPLQ